MKKNIPYLTLAATFALASLTFAEIVIKPVRSPTISTNRPGIIVPGPNGGAVTMGQKPQVIELLNGDALQGTFVEFNTEGGVKWRHPAAKSDIEFESESVSRILLHPRATQIADKQNCRVTLRTGEELLGELIELDENYLLLGAWYSRNSLRIPRKKIFSIAPGGLAGKVDIASEDTCSIILLTDERCQVSVQIVGTPEAGILHGGRGRYGEEPRLILRHLSREAAILPGMKVITTGKGGLFPSNLLVGTVKEYTPGPVEGVALVQPSVNFNELGVVFVIAHRTEEEEG